MSGSRRPPSDPGQRSRGSGRSKPIVLQKSSLRGCRIKICNNRIGANGFLNQRCALTPDLESILRAWTGKIVLQHNRPREDIRSGTKVWTQLEVKRTSRGLVGRVAPT